MMIHVIAAILSCVIVMHSIWSDEWAKAVFFLIVFQHSMEQLGPIFS